MVSLSPGDLCSKVATRPTSPPTMNSSLSCSSIPYDLPVHIRMNATLLGYNVTLKRVIGKGVVSIKDIAVSYFVCLISFHSYILFMKGNKIIFSNYTIKPVVTQAGSDSVVALKMSPGSVCNAGNFISAKPTMNPAARPIRNPTKAPTKAPTSSASLRRISSFLYSTILVSLLILVTS